MSDFYIFEGPDLDDLIHKSLVKLGINENDVEMEIIEEGSDGFLGFGKKNFKIKIIPLVSVSRKKEKTENIDDVLENIEKKNSDKVLLSISKGKEGIYLIAHSEKKGELDDIQKIIEENNIVNVDYDAVKHFLESPDPRVKIAEYDPDIYIDSELTLEISDDEMKAYITSTEPQGGNPPTFESIMAALAQEGIVFGIIESAANEIVKDFKYNEKILIAKGIEPKKGKDGRLEYKINLAKNIKPQLLDDGSVDFKNLNIITNVVKGEVLAEYKSPEKGEDGKDILGNNIEADTGEDISINGFIGKNVELSDDGIKIISLLDGQVISEGDKITVTPVYNIEGDVDLNIGNIDFIGSVIIKGSVLDGFNIKAKGNIEIEKTVGACDLEATGDIIVKGGIMGKDTGKVKANGNIIAKFIENSNVSCKRELVVSRAVMHSNLKGEKIKVMDGKGLIVGGTIRAQDLIECKTLGSHLATKTSIIIGIREEIMKRIEEIDGEVTHVYDDIDKISEALEVLENLKKRMKELPEDKQEKLSKYEVLRGQLEQKIEDLLAERDKLEEEIEGSQGGKLKVKETIYPGVTVTIRKGVMQVKDEIKFATIVYEDGYLKINPYS